MYIRTVSVFVFALLRVCFLGFCFSFLFRFRFFLRSLLCRCVVFAAV